MMKVKPVKLGKTERMSFSHIDEVISMPNLIEVQKNSYQWFLDEGLKEVFHDIGTIEDYTGNLALSFVDFRLDKEPKYSIKECKERDVTYAAPLRVTARLLNKETGEVKDQEIFMGDFPLMTDAGTFVINGAERAIVSQLVRSPGVFYGDAKDKVGNDLYSATMNPNRGAWLEYETDAANVFYVRIDKNRKLPVTVLCRALGLSTNEDILNFFGDDERILATLEKDTTKNQEEGLLEVYRKLRPGEPPTVESATSQINMLFFDPRRYDLSRFGRYKMNKKLSLARRITGFVAAENIVAPLTGEVIVEANGKISRELAEKADNAGVDTVVLLIEGKKVKVITNGCVDAQGFFSFDVKECGINERCSFDEIKKILDTTSDVEEQKEMLRRNHDQLIGRTVTVKDILSSINYLNGLGHGVGTTDDIDHLGNRRIRSVGELLQNQFRIGFSRMERVIRERMTLQSQDQSVITPQALINIRPVVAAIKEFFGSSPLSQFMDQNNPLAELTHKRRLSALGPGGLSRDRAGFEVRDVHYSHYGRMCPIETPEGPNIGLISYLASYAKINEYGFVEAPYRKVKKTYDENGRLIDQVVTDEVEYMTADVEDEYVVAQANEPLDEGKHFIRPRVSARRRDDILEIDAEKVDYMDVSPRMMVSVATACIPFLENDDCNRALMGSNMQRQAVPLMVTQQPIVATGMEYKAATDSGTAVLAKNDGVVEKMDADHVVVRNEQGTLDNYSLIKFARSNAGTCINQRPIVEVGESVKAGQVLADGPAMRNGEISLGKNALIGFMTWEGYNYEDAVLLNEKIVREDVYTSIHIEEYETESRDTKLGPEEITRDIPNVSEDALKDLDERGIIRVGAEVKSGDILVGKVTPKGETELTAEERLLRAIFGEKAIQSCIRESDLLIRYGGDEFLLVLPGIPGDFLQTKLEQIHTAAQMASVPGYSHFRISLSIGGTIQTIADPMENIVRRADWLMYQAKCRKNAVMVEIPGRSLAALETLLQEKSRVLLVDDSKMNRMMLAEILGDSYHVLEAENGKECIEKLQEEAGNIALVLLDINMPVMDGFEVLKAMNANHTIEDTPVIMISSEDSDAAIRRSYELGASDYVNRPFDARIVYRRATNTIKLYAKQRRLVQMVSDQIRARENNTDMLVGVLSHIVEFRNGESGLHVRHIRIITETLLHCLLEVSNKYSISAEQQDLIPLASALHDIGKIGIADKILNKPGKLTPEEFEVIKTHSLLGAEMLQNLDNFGEQPLLQTAYEIARWHHERWNR